jgi:hypothetical protein
LINDNVADDNDNDEDVVDGNTNNYVDDNLGDSLDDNDYDDDLNLNSNK